MSYQVHLKYLFSILFFLSFMACEHKKTPRESKEESVLTENSATKPESKKEDVLTWIGIQGNTVEYKL